MAEKKLFIGSVGPLLFDDDEDVQDPDDDFPGEKQTGVMTEGTVRAKGTPTDPNDLVRKTDMDSMDGDVIDITFSPTEYTPDDSISEAQDEDDLAAHLKGIDNALAEKQNTVSGWSGSFTTHDGKTVTVSDGIITDVA